MAIVAARRCLCCRVICRVPLGRLGEEAAQSGGGIKKFLRTGGGGTVGPSSLSRNSSSTGTRAGTWETEQGRSTAVKIYVQPAWPLSGCCYFCNCVAILLLCFLSNCGFLYFDRSRNLDSVCSLAWRGRRMLLYAHDLQAGSSKTDQIASTVNAAWNSYSNVAYQYLV